MLEEMSQEYGRAVGRFRRKQVVVLFLMHLVNTVIVWTRVSILLSLVIIAASAGSGFDEPYNIGFLVFGIVRFLCLIKVIVALCRATPCPVCIMDYAEFIFACGIMCMYVKKFDEYVKGKGEASTTMGSPTTMNSPATMTTPKKITAAQYASIASISIFVLLSIFDIVCTLVLLIRLYCYVRHRNKLIKSGAPIAIPTTQLSPAEAPPLPMAPPMAPPPGGIPNPMAQPPGVI